mmetsp:Transcript_47293/g.64123  ORF Transcript_47293/g.64123 Transcript_47293/m.64123 type:complete len:340 (+) Transcript_47293:2286-3305(+)
MLQFRVLGELFVVGLVLLANSSTDVIITETGGEESSSVEGNRLKDFLEGGVMNIVRWLSDLLHVSLGFILVHFSSVGLLVNLPVDGGVNDLGIQEHVGHSHSVLGKGTGLVRADARGGTKSLDGLQVLNQNHLLMHSLGGKGKRHSDSSEKTFGHISDNDTNSKHKVGNGIVSIDETKDKESDTEGESDSGDDLDESLNLNGKRGLSRFGSLGKVSNQTNDGVVTSSEDNTSTLTSGALGTEEANVLGLENVGGSLIWETEKLFRFTGKRRVVNLHLGGLEEDGVSGNVVTTFDDDQVTNDEVLGRDRLSLAITDDGGGSGDEVVEFIHQGSGLGGLLV